MVLGGLVTCRPHQGQALDGYVNCTIRRTRTAGLGWGGQSLNGNGLQRYAFGAPEQFYLGVVPYIEVLHHDLVLARLKLDKSLDLGNAPRGQHVVEDHLTVDPAGSPIVLAGHDHVRIRNRHLQEAFPPGGEFVFCHHIGLR